MFGKFIDKATNEFEKTLFMTFFYSGIRVDEFKALRWTDINFEKMTINIERQVTSKVRMNRNIIMTPKSESSIREIIIPNVLNEQLKKWKTSRMELGGFKNKWNVFGDYSFVTENRIRRIANRLLKQTNLPHIRIHDFRHSYSTILHSKEIDPKIIQSQADHASVKTTLDIYTHITLSQKKQAIIDIFNDKNT